GGEVVGGVTGHEPCGAEFRASGGGAGETLVAYEWVEAPGSAGRVHLVERIRRGRSRGRQTDDGTSNLLRSRRSGNVFSVHLAVTHDADHHARGRGVRVCLYGD